MPSFIGSSKPGVRAPVSVTAGLRVESGGYGGVGSSDRESVRVNGRL